MSHKIKVQFIVAALAMVAPSVFAREISPDADLFAAEEAAWAELFGESGRIR